ncbi:MAG: BlaI/MecI/CopY family transcriptional regulator [Verrucomicrobiales bacterium]|nr:BlaI/MecI/CopY family transcriptional regulator [Verrucomicrobiales bacterium]
MSRPKSRFPTELELLILKIFWKRGTLPVREIRRFLGIEASRPLAHTSVVTTLNTMVEKGYLSRKKDGNAYMFTAQVEEKDVSSGMLDDVLKRVFDGSAKALMVSLLESESVSHEEHEKLRRLIEQQKSKDQSFG